MRRLLIANRGEIAVRIARTAREMGLSTVAVHSDVDADALHVRVCDEAVPIGGAEPASSYLRADALIEAARRAGADAVHPGYGFLSENAAFARAVIDAGLIWVGPDPASMSALGDKLAARRAALAAGVPVLPGTTSSAPEAIAALGFPVMLKASGGGGGRGMRRVAAVEELAHALESAAAEAGAAFGDATVYAERLLHRPRHVEVQVLGDGLGGVIHVGERECSVQRRHQKLVEEAACPALDEAGRERLFAAALALAASVRYRGAGTLEFLLDEDGAFYFLEVNTRLQVEHPVSELRSGLDLVREQLRIAMGGGLPPQPTLRGHAFEARIVAEDPAQGFLPSPGRVTRLRWPEGPGVRVDAGVAEGDAVPIHYDPLLAKVIVYGEDREAARRRLVRALRETVILGVTHTGEYLADVAEHPAFAAGALSTDFLARHFDAWTPGEVDAAAYVAAWLAAPGAAPSAAGPARLPTPWERVGRWR